MERQFDTVAAGMFLLIACAVLILLPGFFDVAFAQGVDDANIAEGFSCNGTQPQGKIFEPQGTCSANVEIGQIFSNFVCIFERLLGDLYSNLYCGMRDAWVFPIKAGLTLAITLTGAGFLMGAVDFTAKELALLLAKFVLIWVFATEAEYGVGLAFKFFMLAAREGITFVLSTTAGFSDSSINSTGDVFNEMDVLLSQILHSVGENQDAAIAGAVDSGLYTEEDIRKCRRGLLYILLTAALVVPPIFFVILYVTVKFLLIFVRAVFGYLIGLLATTFLLMLGPIFMSLALFKFSRHFFDKWMQYLISFTIQMVIVFAFIGMVLQLEIRSFFDDALDLIGPWNQTTVAPGTSMDYSLCTICKFKVVHDENSGPFGRPECETDASGRPATWSAPDGEGDPGQNPFMAMLTDEEFLNFVSTNLIGMLVLAYILETMLAYIPEIAKLLGGPRYAGTLGGGSSTFGYETETSIRVPGERRLYRRGGYYPRTSGGRHCRLGDAAAYW